MNLVCSGCRNFTESIGMIIKIYKDIIELMKVLSILQILWFSQTRQIRTIRLDLVVEYYKWSCITLTVKVFTNGKCLIMKMQIDNKMCIISEYCRYDFIKYSTFEECEGNDLLNLKKWKHISWVVREIP